MPGPEGIDELAGLPIGQRIQTIRERRGKTRAVVAGLVGRSDEWLKAVEKGRLNEPRLELLLRIAEALELRDLSELVGNMSLPISLASRASHPVVPDIRAAIEDAPLTVSSDPQPDVVELARRTAAAWRIWHTSVTPRADAGALLPHSSATPSVTCGYSTGPHAAGPTRSSPRCTPSPSRY
jgi:transcriptional regulator with XRE-family HTH domain